MPKGPIRKKTVEELSSAHGSLQATLSASYGTNHLL